MEACREINPCCGLSIKKPHFDFWHLSEKSSFDTILKEDMKVGDSLVIFHYCGIEKINITEYNIDSIMKEYFFNKQHIIIRIKNKADGNT